MKVKITTFDGENLRIARVIFENEARYGATSLLVCWAKLTLERARMDAAPDREGQQELFAERGVA